MAICVSCVMRFLNATVRLIMKAEHDSNGSQMFFLFPSRVLIALTQIFLSCKWPLKVLEGFSSFARKKGDLFEYFVERLLTLYKVTCVFKCGELICYPRKQP